MKKNNYLFFCLMFLSSYTVARNIDFSKQENVPVVFIHSGDSYYLEHALWQAKQYNDRVVLIGDKANDHYSQLNIEHYDIEKYFVGAKYFATIYEHIHVTNYEKQMFNFQRWFILREFMEDNKISRCMYCDSDVMVYCDVSQEIKNFEQYDISLVIPKGHSHCGSNSFWTIGSVAHFCNYLKQYYENKDNLKKWYVWFASPERIKGHGIGDMRILTDYAEHLNKNRSQRMTDICAIIDGATFDHQMSGDDGGLFEMEMIEDVKKTYPMKKIKWIKNQPFCYHAQHKKLIRLKSMHFQGHKKKFMEANRRECIR